MSTQWNSIPNQKHFMQFEQWSYVPNTLFIALIVHSRFSIRNTHRLRHSLSAWRVKKKKTFFVRRLMLMPRAHFIHFIIGIFIFWVSIKISNGEFDERKRNNSVKLHRLQNRKTNETKENFSLLLRFEMDLIIFQKQQFASDHRLIYQFHHLSSWVNLKSF